jgi:serine protease Do
MPGTPAAKAGLEAGDVVTALDGKPLADWRELQVKIGAMEPETSIALTLLRGGKERQVTVKLGELRDREALAGADSGEGEAPNVLDGITVDDLTPETRRQFQVPSGAEGALVTAVEPESRAARAELRPGDVIHEINRQPVRSADDAVALSRKIGEKDKVLLRVSRGGASRFVVLGAG